MKAETNVASWTAGWHFRWNDRSSLWSSNHECGGEIEPVARSRRTPGPEEKTAGTPPIPGPSKTADAKGILRFDGPTATGNS
jgi:hypothetical protein